MNAFPGNCVIGNKSHIEIFPKYQTTGSLPKFQTGYPSPT